MSLATPTQAQVVYVQSSNFQTVPVSQSVVVTRSFSSSRYSNSFGNSRSNSFGAARAWNNRTSAPAVYFQANYLPESEDYYPAVSSRAVAASQPVTSSRVVSSRVISSQPVVVSQPRIFSQPAVTYQSVVSSQPVEYVEYSDPVYVSQPVVTSRSVVSSQPVISSEPVVVSQPVRVYRSVVSSPRVTREEIEYRPNRVEYEQKGTVQATDGRRVKTYRYEYEVDQRPGRTKVTFEFDN